ncbi:MAG: hypothetical protein CL534_19740 [Ahrensia sp.]|jgi:hypothetical protein|nr:hypothetical protein [Ahrensia sp.]
MRALAISLALLFMTLFQASAAETVAGMCGLDAFASPEREAGFLSATSADVDADDVASSVVFGHCANHHLMPFISAQLRLGLDGIHTPFCKVDRLSGWHRSPPDYPPIIS